jgi:predicted nucleic acid-binding protein
VFAALLDSSVLWPNRQRDFLLSLAVFNLYRPLWSSAILDEVYDFEVDKYTEIGAHQDEAEEKAARLIAQMRANFDDAEVPNWEPLEGTFGLRDPDDEHVLAAAVAGHAGAVVTSDKDFESHLMPPGIQVVNPTEFAANTVAVQPELALDAVTAMSARLQNPPMSIDEILDFLRDQYGMEEAVELIRDVR